MVKKNDKNFNEIGEGTDLRKHGNKGVKRSKSVLDGVVCHMVLGYKLPKKLENGNWEIDELISRLRRNDPAAYLTMVNCFGFCECLKDHMEEAIHYFEIFANSTAKFWLVFEDIEPRKKTKSVGKELSNDVVLSWFNQYKCAAENGNAKAQFCLALMYARGIGTRKDIKTGIRWYKKFLTATKPESDFLLIFDIVFND